MRRPNLVLPFAVILLAGCAPRQQTITVTMSSFAFDPANLTARAGQTVRVLLDNPDTIPHAFDIPELGVGLAVIPEAAVEIEFIATDPGTYVYFCGIEGHREAGMEGVLIVEP